MTKSAGASPRVLFLFTEVFAKGGIQRFNQTIIDACVQLGIHCDVLSLNDSKTDQRENSHITAIGFAGNRRRFAFAAAGVLLRGRYDRVLIGHINLLILAAGILMLRPFRRPPTLLVAHGIEVWSGIDKARRHALARIDRILCVSHYTRSRILDQAPALRADRLVIFPNALADSWGRITAPQTAPAPHARFILSVTRLERGDRYKGVASVIEAFSMLADTSIQYFVVGRGDDLPFLQLLAERYGVKDRVHFMSGVGDSALISLYRQCEAFVLPSGKEGFGIVFLEAMFFGAPVIAAAEKGAVDVVRDGETGLSVPYGDTMAIKGAIERVLSDLELREHLRANGRAMVVGDGPFTFRQFTRRCADVFEVAAPMPSERGVMPQQRDSAA
jgi:phosphatidyl-myo-inositol dimannoside synthase